MSCCSNYVEHAWRKGKCLNCFHPKCRHVNAAETRATNDQTNGSKLQNGAENKCDLQLPNANENQVKSVACADNNSTIVSRDCAKNNDEKNTRTYKNDLPCTSNPITLSLSTVTENHRSDVDIALKDTELSERKTEFIKAKPVPKPRPRRKFSLPQPCEAADTTKDREIGAVATVSIKAEDKNIEEFSKASCTSPENDKNGTKVTQDELNTVCESDENSGKVLLKPEEDVRCEIASPIETSVHHLNIATGEIENCTSDNDLLSKHENNLLKPDTISALQEMECNNSACQVNEMQPNTSENDYVAMNGNSSATGRHDIDDFIDCKEIAGVKEITGKEENSVVGSGIESSPRDSSLVHKLKWSLDRQTSPSRELLEDFKFELPRTTAMGGRESSYVVATDYEQFSPSLSCKVTLAEPFYENRPSSVSSDSRSQSAASSCDNFSTEKVEYENTLSRGSVVSPSLSDIDSDVFSNGTTEGLEPSYENTINSDSKCSLSGMSDSLKSNDAVFVEQNMTESSGDSVDTDQSDSTWDSSECDSQPIDSNIETSTSSENACGSKICTIPTIPENEILTECTVTTNSRIQRKTNFTPEKAKTRQSNPDISDRINEESPQSFASKLLTKPYKVVDVSSGLLFQPNSLSNDSSDVPPLPPKTRDLQKESPEENQHEYMPPPENVAQKNQYNLPQPAPVNVRLPSSESRPQYVRKTPPVPRPRSISSERNSQFGSLPRPAPRTSRILVDSMTDGNKGPCNGKVTECGEVVTEPPFPSTIPVRQSTEGISTLPALPLSSPPLSPEKTSASTAQTQVSDRIDTPQSPKSEGGRTAEGLVAKPKRMAPPPPVGGNQRPKSPEESKTVYTAARSYSNTSSAISPMEPETVSSPKPVSQPNEKSAALPLTEQSSPAPSPTMERKYFKANSLKKAWLKFSKKRNSKNYRSLEISGPILVNEEVPGFLEQREEVKRRTMSESAMSARHSVSSEIDDANSPFVEQSLSQIPSEDQQNENVVPTSSQSVQFCGRSHGYQNFPLSKVDGVFEKPKKPARATKAVRPLGHETDTVPVSSKAKVDGTVIYREEPAYLQPCETEITRKVEEALSKLNDATLLAEALSRVAQEKLGPLPNVPQPRHVDFHYNEAKCVTEDPSPSSQAKRPVRIVNPTLVNGVAGSPNAVLDEYKTAKPKLPSRPPNTKLRDGHRERSYSADGKYLFQTSIPRSKSESSQSRKLVKTYNKMRELHLQTLQEVVNSAKRSLLPPKNLDISNTAWKDYEICDDLLDVHCPGVVLLPVKLVGSASENVLLAKIEVPQQSTSTVEQHSCVENDLRVSEAMERHVNIFRVLIHFADQIPAEIIGLQGAEVCELNVGITDQFPLETVTDFLSRTKVEHEEQPKSYEKKVCLLMIQLFSALLHLHDEAVVHRDLSTDNLLLLENGLLMVANFMHAHQQLSHSSPFLLRRDSLSFLGGNVGRLPPEILNPPEDAKSLDFEKCDVFAAGCLIYEMLHEKSPFSRDSSLIGTEQQPDELLSLPERSYYSRGLKKIASRLLCADPQQRIDAKKALEMLRVVIWGPHCLEDSGTCSLENMAADWIENERLHMVTLFALNQVQTFDHEPDDFMEKFLKCQYLVEANEQSILDSYKQVIMNAEDEN